MCEICVMFMICVYYVCDGVCVCVCVCVFHVVIMFMMCVYDGVSCV